MCGIAGIVQRQLSTPIDATHLAAMAAKLKHRGPDDEGLSLNRGVGLAFRRLSIIDLSPKGRQPMTTDDGALSLVCNGEIYNHLELRKVLIAAGFQFASRTDVEVILHGYSHWGVAVLDRLDGMFAFALWDKKNKQVLLARDRLGIKPLCYYEDETRFAFASELPALLALPGIDRELDPGALWNYLSEMQVPAPQSPFKKIRKFMPAQAMLLSWDQKQQLSARTWKYWKLPRPAPSAKVSLEDASRTLRHLLENAVRSHLVGDVPVGALLSGGVDSSIITALASRMLGEPVRTFSATFPGMEGVDESAYQKLIVDRYHTRHHEYRATSEALQLARELVTRAGEPCAIMSAIPLLGVSRLARTQTKVVLSGDGSDELFAGYGERYVLPRSWVTFDLLGLPKGAFALAHAAVTRLGGRFNRGEGFYGRLRKHLLDGSQTRERRHRERRTSGFSYAGKLQLLSDQWSDQASGLGEAVYEEAWEQARSMSPENHLEQALYFEMGTSLPDEMLRKADLCSSCVGLEARVPFMDRAVVEYAAGLPLACKLRENQGKLVLKAACDDLIPREILERKKQGFNVPMRVWIRAVDFRSLGAARLPFLRMERVREILSRHAGGENWDYPLWILENYRVWVEEFGLAA